MEKDFPNLKSKVQKNKLVILGKIQPTDYSTDYLIKIEYKIGSKPEISVLDPPLIGDNIPHVYKGNHPCVYFPPGEEWNSRKYLSKTVIPFLASWLYFYEVWRITGTWEGGGVHIIKKQ